VRTPAWQAAFLAQPIAARRAFAARARDASQQRQGMLRDGRHAGGDHRRQSGRRGRDHGRSTACAA
jgi:hypothetical protein